MPNVHVKEKSISLQAGWHLALKSVFVALGWP